MSEPVSGPPPWLVRTLKRFRHCRMSRLVSPSPVRQASYVTVGVCQRRHTMATRWSAAFTWRCRPRNRRCRFVMLLYAGIWHTPQSFANAAAE